jgi:prepilin-type N-terminal cleavage/methylation domain-containing protein
MRRLRDSARRGFTLMEILVSILIISILMGISVSMLSRISHDSELEAVGHAAHSMLRGARNASQDERWGAVVELDWEARELRAQVRTGITHFRFDTPPPPPVTSTGDPDLDTDGVVDDGDLPPPFEVTGARGFVLTVEGGGFVAANPRGLPGDGLVLAEEESWAWIEDRPVLSPQEGVYVECWVYVLPLDETLGDTPATRERGAEGEGGRYERAGAFYREAPDRVFDYDPYDPPIYNVLRKGRAYALGVTAEYELELALTGPRAIDGDPDAEGAEVTLVSRTQPGTLRPHRWYRLGLSYDGRQARVFVDGIPRQHLPLEGLDELPIHLIRDTAPLAISDPDPRRSFYGVIDEVKLATLIRGQVVEIPQDVIPIAASRTIHFDVLGQLDPAHHAQPFVLYLCDDPRALAVYQDGAAADGGDPRQTRTRQEQAEQDAGGAEGDVMQRALRRFLALLQAEEDPIDPKRVRTIIVERTGMVRTFEGVTDGPAAGPGGS